MDNMSSDYSSQRSQFIQGCTGFAAGATAAVALRLFARWKNSTKIAWDDLSIALSLIPLWALAGTGVAIATYGGLAQQDDTLTPAQKAVFYPVSLHRAHNVNIPLTEFVVGLCLLHSICSGDNSRETVNSPSVPPNFHFPPIPSYTIHIYGPLYSLVHFRRLGCHFPLQSRSGSLVHGRGSYRILHPPSGSVLRHQLNEYRSRYPHQSPPGPTNLGSSTPQETAHPPGLLHVPRNSQHSRRHRSHPHRSRPNQYKPLGQHCHALLIRHHRAFFCHHVRLSPHLPSLSTLGRPGHQELPSRLPHQVVRQHAVDEQ